MGDNVKYVFLLNTFRLKDKTSQLVKKIQDFCALENIRDYVIEKNSSLVSTEDILEKYQKEEVILFPVGGDGTIHRVLNGLVGTRNVLGFIPYGTGNEILIDGEESNVIYKPMCGKCYIKNKYRK